MPLFGQYAWTETDDQLQITIPLKATTPSKVDIYATHCVLKVAFPPYLVDIDLHGSIDETKSKASIKDGVLLIKVPKADGHKSLWGRIEVSKEVPRSEIKERRVKSIADKEKAEAELMERVKNRKYEDERVVLRAQMASESAERQQLDDLKAAEKTRAEEEVFATLERLHVERTSNTINSANEGAQVSNATQDIRSSAVLAIHDECVADSKAVERVLEESEDELQESDNDEHSSEKDVASDEESRAQPREGEQLVDVDIARPEPRNGARVTLGFTPRLFPTPTRESKAAEEEAWIMKNRKHLTKNPALKGRLPQNLGIEERDPTWLKGKGDDFFRAGDYRSAINAYTDALEADAEMVSALSNRAACHLKLGALEECVKDCSDAITALERGPGGIQTQLMRLLARRGAALGQLGHYKISLDDFKQALELDPGSVELRRDAERVAILQQCSDIKRQADQRFSEGDMDSALALYTRAYNMDPTFVSCISNRAGCHLALGLPDHCVEDCTTALKLLAAPPGVCTGPIPPPGSDKRRKWVLRTLARRGAAFVQSGVLESAVKDYREACKLAPEDEALAKDLAELEGALLKQKEEKADRSKRQPETGVAPAASVQ